MRKLLLTLIFATFFSVISAQDLIVTNKNDSINCKIAKIIDGNIYFTSQLKNEIRNTSIPENEVISLQINYYEDRLATPDLKISKPDTSYDRFRFAANIGYGIRTAKISDEIIDFKLKDYMKKLKTGYTLSGDFTAFFSKGIGVGAKYIYFNSSNSLDNATIYDESANSYNASISDDINIHFWGPFLATRAINRDKKGAFYYNLGFGQLRYVNYNTIGDLLYINKGSTVGVLMDIGYDIVLSQQMMLGFQISFIGGSLKKMDVTSGNLTQRNYLDSDKKEKLSRFDFSIGLRFR